jgi:two-component system sensor histidine kinase KdpD
VHADAGLLERVIANLVQNALRHATEGTTVRVAGSYHDGRVELRVIDRGPGIPAAAEQHVFEPFQRLHDHASGTDGGVGLGLAIAQRIAIEHGGELAFVAPGARGAEFRLVLPIEGPPPVSEMSPPSSA